jgi:hypothetical protein
VAVRLIDRIKRVDDWLIERHERAILYAWDNFGVSRITLLRVVGSVSMVATFLDTGSLLPKCFAAFSTIFVQGSQEYMVAVFGDRVNNARTLAMRGKFTPLRLALIVYNVTYSMSHDGGLFGWTFSLLSIVYFYMLFSLAPLDPPMRKKEEEKLAWQPSL